MTLDILHLLRPAVFIHPISFKAPAGGNSAKAGFGEEKPCAAWSGFQPEFDKCRGFLRVVDFGAAA
jgi:hypothetical protein